MTLEKGHSPALAAGGCLFCDFGELMERFSFF